MLIIVIQQDIVIQIIGFGLNQAICGIPKELPRFSNSLTREFAYVFFLLFYYETIVYGLPLVPSPSTITEILKTTSNTTCTSLKAGYDSGTTGYCNTNNWLWPKSGYLWTHLLFLNMLCLSMYLMLLGVSNYLNYFHPIVYYQYFRFLWFLLCYLTLHSLFSMIHC
mgnify:CR=1 FL=1